MTEERTIKAEETSGLEPLTIQELLAHAIEDASAGESAEFVVEEFFSEFVNQDRPETYQVLQMLDMPNELIIQSLVDVQLRAFEVFKTNAPGYLNELRNIMGSRIKGIAKN